MGGLGLEPVFPLLDAVPEDGGERAKIKQMKLPKFLLIRYNARAVSAKSHTKSPNPRDHAHFTANKQ